MKKLQSEIRNKTWRFASDSIGLSRLATVAGCLCLCATAHATLISSLDTGAGLYAGNTGASIVDPNWNVSLLSTVPANQTPPGGLPDGNAYLVPNNIGFPFNGYWVPNSETSTWITYSYPTQVGGDLTDDTFQYQVAFTALSSGEATINFASDNASVLYINGVPVGSSGVTGYGSFTSITYDFITGNSYYVDYDVNNAPQGSGNPTAANVQFLGDINVAPIPEASNFVAGALMLLPFGIGAIRSLRKERV